MKLFNSMIPNNQPQHTRNQLQSFLKTVGIPFLTTGMTLLASTVINKPLSVKAADPIRVPPTPARGYQTKSGLRYFDLYINPNYTETPKYGQLVTFHYTIYYNAFNQPPSSSAKLEIIDSTHYETEPFLHKHGNSQIIRGIDEALHTMKLGSRRRVFIPKNLAYVEPGIGPIPLDPFRRKKLNSILNDYEKGKGDLVIDLELMMIADDEADPGYYEDIPMDVQEARSAVMESMEKNRENNRLLKDLLGEKAGGGGGDLKENLSRESFNSKRKENQSLKER